MSKITKNPARVYFMEKMDEYKKLNFPRQWTNIDTRRIQSLKTKYNTHNYIRNRLIHIEKRMKTTIPEKLHELQTISLENSIEKMKDDFLDKLSLEGDGIDSLFKKTMKDIQFVIDNINQLKNKDPKDISYLKKFGENIQRFSDNVWMASIPFIQLMAEPIANNVQRTSIMGRHVEFNDNFIGTIPEATPININLNKNALSGRYPSVLPRRNISRRNLSRRPKRLQTRVSTRPPVARGTRF